MKPGQIFPMGPGFAAPVPLDIRARATGEFRCPKAGEYFLSGAIIEGYRAKKDMDTEYYIAKLVEMETITTMRVKRELPN